MDVREKTGEHEMRASLPYPSGSLVEVRKIDASDEPISGPGSWENWVPGSANSTGSLPVGYTMQGVLMCPVRVGGRIDLHRTHRNGICFDGHFVSTPVIVVSGHGLVETYNSIYLIRKVDVHDTEHEEEE